MTSPICIEIHGIIFLDLTNRFLCQLRYIEVFLLPIIITIGEPKECNYYVLCNVTFNYKNTLYISVSQVSIIIYRLLEKKDILMLRLKTLQHIYSLFYITIIMTLPQSFIFVTMFY